MTRSIAISIVSVLLVAACAKAPDITPTRITEDRARPDSVAYTEGSLLSGLRVGRPAFQSGTPLRDRAWSADARKFSFAIIGDRTGGGQENWGIFDEAIDEVNLLRPDFAIMVGDLVQGYHSDSARARAEWETFWSHAENIRVPFLTLPGNHDVTTPLLMSYWTENVGRMYYSFDYLGCHFLVLNSEQERFSGTWDFGPEQMEFVLADLERSRSARHTFLFMHKPVWAWAESTYVEDWARIVESLGDREFTVFAGHRHNATYEVRDGHRYFILGPTGGSLRASDAPEMGAFHHYTWVTVDGDSTYVNYIRPGGGMFPEDVSTREFMQGAYGLVTMEARSTEFTADGGVVPTLDAVVENRLPDSVEVALRFTGLRDRVRGWELTSGPDTVRATLAPGERRVYTTLFHTTASGLNAMPSVSVSAWYHGAKLYQHGRRVPVFPAADLVAPDAWLVIGSFAPAEDEGSSLTVVGQFAAGTILAADGTVLPGATVPLSEEKFATWESLATDETGRLDLSGHYETTEDALAYGAVTLTSPDARQVWVEVIGDDNVWLNLNGVAVADGRSFTDDVSYVPLTVRAGENTLVVKSENTGSGWSYRLRFVDPERRLTLGLPGGPSMPASE